MKQIFFTIFALISLSIKAQTLDIDLSEKKGKSIDLDLGIKAIRLINCSKNVTYELDWKVTKVVVQPFDTKAFSSDESKLKDCSKEVQELKVNLDSENDEGKIKKFVDDAIKLIEKLGNDNCALILKTSIDETQHIREIPFVLVNNQIITLTITKVAKNGTKETSWSYTLKTPEKTRWLIHYGLTYAPNIISKVDHYFSQADTSATNKYTITKENDNGPKQWENISATINFTYPIHSDSRDFDWGFTAGFGLNAGFELSGHTGLSAIIGENVIIGTGIAFMQKFKLMGAYKENQVIKTNLNFEALHHKVWLPELYFTIGFRFNSNPFAKKTTEDKSTKPAEPNK